MSLVSFLRKALLLLVPVALLLTTYLYTYPVFHLCAFPAPDDDSRSAYINTLRQHALPQSHDASAVAPFRLLALGDPQLEGDTSIDPDAFAFTALNKFLNDFLLRDGTKHNPLQWLRHCLHDLVDFYLDDIPKALEVYRKRLDHIGNDYYLGHQYRTLYWWANPTHVTVLGDLVGSQWIDDEEFETRGWRYWNRVFKHGQRVADEIASQPADDFEDTLILGEDAEFWKRRIINVAGNHDIGYAGDLTEHRMARFVRVFGKANYELRFQLPIDSKALNGTYGDLSDSVGETPELRIVILNDMNLDTPAVSQELQDETYNFLNKVITTSYDVGRRALFTLVLTHIPLYKEAGICVDGPLFDFHGDDVGGGIREQNHLSLDASKGFLEGIFGMSASKHADGGGMGRRGLIMNGHDHDGCDIYHYMNQSSSDEALNEYERRLSEDALAEFLLPTPEPPKWQAKRLRDAKSENLLTRSDIPGIQEATIRSMMGDFGGNAGLLSLWFDHASWEWKYEFVNCALGTQHIWWFVHIVDLIVAIIVLGWAFLELALQLQVTKPQSAKEPTNMNGYAKAGKKEIKVEEDSKIDPGVVEFVSGKLDSPGSGKLSLRKKSKLGLNGGITGNGPLYSI